MGVRMRHAARSVLALLVLAWGATALHAEDYLFFKILEVEKGGMKSSVLFPHLIHFDSALAQRDLLNGLVSEMGKGREALYGRVLVSWMGEGKAEVKFVAEPAPDLFSVIAELHYSLRFNGIKDVSWVDNNGARVDWGVQPYPVFLPVVSYLGTLDPVPFPDTVVSLGEERWLSGTAFEDLRRKNPGELKRIFTDAFKRVHSLVKAYLLERLDKVPLDNLDNSLIGLLSDPSPAIRLKAIDLLRGSKTPAVTAALEKVVDADTDASVKSRAVTVLDGFGVTKYRVFILFDKLRSTNDTEVQDAEDQLIASGDPRVAVGLASVLGHGNDAIRQKATDGILKFNDPKGYVAVLERGDVPDAIKERFAMALIANTFADLRAKGYGWVLIGGSDDKKVEALKSIGDKRETGLLPRVQDKLTDPSPAVARQAAATLASFKDVGSLEKLVATAQARADLAGDMETAVIAIIGSMRLPDVINLAKSENFALRKFATKSLAEFTKTSPKLDPKVQAILEERMGDANIEIKRAAVYALARAKNEAIVTKLAALADDPDDQIREQVLVSLTQLPVGPARDIFLKKLDDPYDPVRLQAIKGVRVLKIVDAIQKLSWLRQTPKADLRIEVVTTLAELMNLDERRRSFDMWSEALYDQEVAIKSVAMEMLSCIKGDPRVAPTLSALVLDPDKTIKTRALAALGATGDPAAVEYIVQGLFDLDPEVKKAALEGLRTLHSSAAEKPLQEFVKNESDPELRRLAEDVLTSLL